MGTLSYILLYYHYIECVTDLNLQNAKGIRTDEASGSERRARRPGRCQEGGAAVQTRGGEEDLGLPQGPQAPGPREQAVLQARRQDEADLRRRQGPRLRHGQVPQEPPDQPVDYETKIMIFAFTTATIFNEPLCVC